MNEYANLIKGNLDTLLSEMDTCSYLFSKNPRTDFTRKRKLKIPTAKDIPMKIIPILIENPQPDGPYGARGIGEHPMISVPSVIGNALFDALGINFYKLPLSPENVALAIAKKMG